MWSIARVTVFLNLALLFNPLSASDACLDRAIQTAAHVKVSDGSHFATDTFFQSPGFSAIRHIRDDVQLVAVEGPFSWVSRGEKSQMGGENLKQFALGHQFHALLLHFDEVVADITPKSEVLFRGLTHQGKGGKYPYGGEIILIHDGDKKHPEGLVLALPDTPRMEIVFSDWREQGGFALPFQVDIDDGSQLFNYTYSRVEIMQASPFWYLDTVAAPAIDQVQIYRLHRRLLAAHCVGDADLIADLSMPQSISSSRGSLDTISREAMRSQFADVFKKVDYLHYEDIVNPVIEVSQTGDIGWIAVNVRARGEVIGNDRYFDDQWSWIMLARNVDGRWMHAGNASNRLVSSEAQK